MNGSVLRVIFSEMCIAVLISVVQPRLVRAEGAPAVAALTYSGTLLNDGVPVSGLKRVGAALWATSHSGGTTEPECTIPQVELALDAMGRFRLPLDSCVKAIRTKPDLWLELQIEGAVLSPRAKLGAVPYATEATNATRVTQQSGARKLTLQGQYCGVTPPVDGRLNLAAAGAGYATAKGLCEVACQGSATAHVCMAEELVRIQQLGARCPETPGWIATGIATMGSDGAQCTANDCQGFTSNEGPSGGSPGACDSVWTGQTVTTQSCHQSVPLLCCD
jgi:hypothetical protein